jgi:hypothetical protein
MDYVFMNVTVGKFKNNRTELLKINEGVSQNKIYDVQNKICILSNSKYIDVEDFDVVYSPVETNKYGIILPNQKVEKDNYYALNAKQIDKKDISLLQSINIKTSYTKYKKKH